MTPKTPGTGLQWLFSRLHSSGSPTSPQTPTRRYFTYFRNGTPYSVPMSHGISYCRYEGTSKETVQQFKLKLKLELNDSLSYFVMSISKAFIPPHHTTSFSSIGDKAGDGPLRCLSGHRWERAPILPLLAYWRCREGFVAGAEFGAEVLVEGAWTLNINLFWQIADTCAGHT